MISPKLCASKLALELLRAAVHAAAVTVALATCTVEGPRAGAADAAAASDECDLSRKVDIMRSLRWQQAIAELREWLDTQTIHPPAEVRRIKVRFNERVAAMSSYELEYLLDDLDAKFQVMDSPEARDARAWVGQYLSAMSDRKRAETLKDVPNVVTMSAGELQREITAIEQKRAGIREQQAAFDQSRRQMVQMAEDSRKETAAAAAAGMAEARASFSPYRNQGPGQTPFANVRTGADMTSDTPTTPFAGSSCTPPCGTRCRPWRSCPSMASGRSCSSSRGSPARPRRPGVGGFPSAWLLPQSA